MKCKGKHNVSICEPYRGEKSGNELKQIVSRGDAARVSATVLEKIPGTLT